MGTFGKPCSQPPEAILEQPYNHKIDVWASGCILYEMLTGEHPFQTESFVQVRRKVQAGPNLSHPLLVPLTNTNLDLLDLLLKMFDPTVSTRIDTLGDAILSHPYFTKSTPTIGMDNVEFGWNEFQFLKSGCQGYVPSHPQVTQTHPQTLPLTQSHDSIRLRGTLVEHDSTLLTANELSQPQPVHIPKEESHSTQKQASMEAEETIRESPLPLNTSVPLQQTRFGRRAGGVGESKDKVRMVCEFCGVAVEIEKMEEHISQNHKDDIMKKKEEERRRIEEEQNRIKMREEEKRRKEEKDRKKKEAERRRREEAAAAAQREREEEQRRKKQQLQQIVRFGHTKY
ncbi:hypothetical protein BLNAU_4787 [Blattamonas nauphoetae]|uniref:Protein kinase domain-containing protein n=1 Tax=Blattamonas nauphoetae TaxID=2049346 RepID=A0ABQ9Y958_9EUKA|nr:hypothetical protein BLNAU_4787 [Blattamonas nauphoetae]